MLEGFKTDVLNLSYFLIAIAKPNTPNKPNKSLSSHCHSHCYRNFFDKLPEAIMNLIVQHFLPSLSATENQSIDESQVPPD